MPNFLIEHLDGCSPLTPCLSCKANEYLKAHLKPEEYSEFTTLVLNGSAQKHRYLDLDARVEDIFPDFSVRTRNCLQGDKIETIRQLTQKTVPYLLRTPNFGRTGIKEIEDALALHGLSLRDR